MLSRHPLDEKKKHEGGRNKRNRNDNVKEKADNDETIMLSFAQMEGRCYCCGKANDRSDKCRQMDKIPKQEWAINKAKSEDKSQSHAQLAEVNTTKPSNNTNNREARVGWASVQI